MTSSQQPASQQSDREQQLTAEVLAAFAATPDPRLREILTALVAHLHAFARDVRLTEDEWAAGIEFLTAVGHRTDDRRQEFVLLSDVLGLSMQIVTINDAADDGVTESDRARPVLRRRRARGAARRGPSAAARAASRAGSRDA